MYVAEPLEFIRSFEVEILNAGFVALTVLYVLTMKSISGACSASVFFSLACTLFLFSLVDCVKIRENSPVEVLDNVDGDEYEEGIDHLHRYKVEWRPESRAPVG